MTKVKHEIVTGRFVDGRIERPFWAGNAYYDKELGFFEVKISLFNEPWYLSANQESETFTVFKEKVEEDGKMRFRCPIGKAFLADELKSYLEINIPLWNPKFKPYLCLYPSK